MKYHSSGACLLKLWLIWDRLSQLSFSLSSAQAQLALSSVNFAPWHQATKQTVLLLPALAILRGNIIPLTLFFNRPANVPKWTRWLALGGALVAWAATILFQVPIQMGFDQGYYSPP
jgi:hypothetical protein